MLQDTCEYLGYHGSAAEVFVLLEHGMALLQLHDWCPSCQDSVLLLFTRVEKSSEDETSMFSWKLQAESPSDKMPYPRRIKDFRRQILTKVWSRNTGLTSQQNVNFIFISKELVHLLKEVIYKHSSWLIKSVFTYFSSMLDSVTFLGFYDS